MIDSLFILQGTGNVIIEKHWRTVIPRAAVDIFWDARHKYDRPEEVPPVIATDQYYLHHIYSNGLFLLAVVIEEAPPSSVLHFLHRVVELLTDYFGSVSEGVIKENFVIVYELLEEMLDYGNPYITEPSILKDLIPPPSILSTVINAVSLGTNFGTKLPSGSMSSVPWRSAGIKYTNNEMFIDLVEEVDAILDKHGNVVVADIKGEVLCNSKLSGMPDLILTFINSRVLEDGMVSFHPCVRYHRFEKERLLSFVPPDGNFKLMEYNASLTSSQSLPVYVRPTIILKKGSGKLDISLQPRATSAKPIENAVLSVTLPDSVSSVKLSANVGQCSFDQNTKQIRWTVGKVAPDFGVTGVPVLTGNIYMGDSEDAVPVVNTVSVDFKINMHTASGLRIDSLQVHNEPYKPYKGVRSVTKSGRYQIRV